MISLFNLDIAWYYIVIFFVAFGTTMITTPFVIKFAHKINAVDIPKDPRKIHFGAMPRFGISMFIGLFVSVAVFAIISKMNNALVVDKKLIGYIIGSTILMIFCIVDDVKGIRAPTKLLGQLIASIVIVMFGVHIGNIEVPFLQNKYIDFGALSFPITVIWIIGITNAINLIDGLDGLAAGVSNIASISLLFVFLINPFNLEALVITSALAGATMGFLPFNFNPARIFMGDTGSNFLGYTLATVSVLGLAKGYTFIVIVAPILILGLPIFDTGFAIIRRILKGKSILEADRGHLHHRLLDMGLNQKQVVLALYCLTCILGIIAIALVKMDIIKILILLGAIIFFVIAGVLCNNKENKKIEEKKIEEKKDEEKQDEEKNNGYIWNKT